MKRVALLGALLLGAGSIAPQPSLARSHHASAFPVTVVDDLHTKVRISHRPARIVSLDPRDTETLFALGLGKRVVADSSSCAEGAAGIKTDFRYPSQWPSPWGRDYPVRSLQLPHTETCTSTSYNLELIESLRPDLVLSLNSDLPDIQRLRGLGLAVMVLDPANLTGIFHDIQIVGRATGTERQASVVVGNMKKSLRAVRQKLAKVTTRPTVYYEIDATNPTEPYTAGPGTFIDDAITIARGKNVADSVTSCSGTTCYPQLSLESLVSLDPQIIVLGDAAYGTTAASVKSRSGWNTISAVQTGKIYPFDDELISRAGPRIVIGIEKLAKLIHPDAFHRA